MAHEFLIEAADDFLRELRAALADGIGTAEAGAASARLIAQLRAFERQALRLCGDAATVAGASYLLCTLADELLTRRRGLSWTVESLLVYHHADAHGGQRCWALLDELLDAATIRRPAHRKPLLALYDLAMALGLRGRHDLQPDGEQALQALRARLVAELGDETDPARGAADLVALAARHVRPDRHWLAPGLVLAVVAGLVVLHGATQRRLETRWLDAAQAATRAAGAALQGPAADAP